jgi:hypothetical protein
MKKKNDVRNRIMKEIFQKNEKIQKTLKSVRVLFLTKKNQDYQEN